MRSFSKVGAGRSLDEKGAAGCELRGLRCRPGVTVPLVDVASGPAEGPRLRVPREGPAAVDLLLSSPFAVLLRLGLCPEVSVGLGLLEVLRRAEAEPMTEGVETGASAEIEDLDAFRESCGGGLGEVLIPDLCLLGGDPDERCLELDLVSRASRETLPDTTELWEESRRRQVPPRGPTEPCELSRAMHSAVDPSCVVFGCILRPPLCASWPKPRLDVPDSNRSEDRFTQGTLPELPSLLLCSKTSGMALRVPFESERAS